MKVKNNLFTSFGIGALLMYSYNTIQAQTLNYLPKWYPDNSTFSNSLIYDNGTNVGIGTASPGYYLDIQHSTSPIVRTGITSGSSTNYAAFIANDIANNKVLAQLMGGGNLAGTLFGVNRAGTGQFYSVASPLVIGTVNTYDLTFGTNSTANMTIKNGGNVGIGTTNPASKLHVSKSGAEGFEFYPGYTANSNIFQGYNRSSAVYTSLESRFADYHFKNGTTEVVTINTSGNVGVNTTNPLAKLHVSNGSLLLNGETGGTPTSDYGTRLMWIPAKAAFREGKALSTEWDDANIGLYSAGFNLGGWAKGWASSAFGYNSMAFGEQSVSFGLGSMASGNTSASFGNGTVAQSYCSVALGQYNIASGTTTSWIATDPLFVIGNGSSASVRSNAVTVLKNGKTLIGNPALSNFQGTPDGYLLFVQQGILTEKVKVAVSTTSDWSDYVFDKSYKLKNLKELELYLAQNKHLPNIPSAEEVVNNGIDVAAMDAKLLAKIEELTLYIIELNKKIENLEAKQ